VGTGKALRRELGVWAGVVAEKSGNVRECARAGPRRVRGRVDLTGKAHRTEIVKRDAWGNGSATGEPGPRGRGRREARRGKQLAPTG
jgi:hypothetical protein